MEVLLGNLVDLGLRDLLGDALAGGEGVSRGDSCGERRELMSMAVSEEKPKVSGLVSFTVWWIV